MNLLLDQAHKDLESGDNTKLKWLLSGLEVIKVNGGGHINHEFFWESLAPMWKGGGIPPKDDSELGLAIQKAFASFDIFVSWFSAEIKYI